MGESLGNKTYFAPHRASITRLTPESVFSEVSQRLVVLVVLITELKKKNNYFKGINFTKANPPETSFPPTFHCS